MFKILRKGWGGKGKGKVPWKKEKEGPPKGKRKGGGKIAKNGKTGDCFRWGKKGTLVPPPPQNTVDLYQAPQKKERGQGSLTPRNLQKRKSGLGAQRGKSGGWGGDKGMTSLNYVFFGDCGKKYHPPIPKYVGLFFFDHSCPKTFELKMEKTP